MITDGPRMKAYVDALQSAVCPGSTVMDLGAGTGMFSLLACQYGARHVYAVEPDKAILIARAAAEANGYLDRISFHQGFSSELTFPEQVDVLISDLRGVLPLYTSHIPSIVDARSRFLKPNGIQIPRRDRINLALVESPKTYEPCAQPWTTHPYGLDLMSGHQYVVNSWNRFEAHAEDLLTLPVLWAELDYLTVVDPNFSGSVSSAIIRPGTAHGLAVWFDADLGNGIGYSNAPGNPTLVYGQAFFPLFFPVKVEEGDILNVDLRADLIEGDYVWSWQTKITGRGGLELKADYKQSSFFAQPIEQKKLRQREANYIPQPSSTLDLQRFCLSLVDGERSLESIARELTRSFPNRYKTWNAALTDVFNIVDRAQ